MPRVLEMEPVDIRDQCLLIILHVIVKRCDEMSCYVIVNTPFIGFWNLVASGSSHGRNGRMVANLHVKIVPSGK